MTEKKTGTRTIVKPQSMSMSEGTSQFHVETAPLDPFDDGKKRKLKLDYDTQKPAKSRQQLYNEMKQEEEILDQDVYQYASIVERGISLAIDCVFIFILYKLVVFLVPLEFKLSHYFMDQYKIQFMFGEAAFIKLLLILSTIAALFFGIVFPMAFFNNSLGKKLVGLKVRGDEKYTLTISEAFMREVIMKPISMGCLVGFVLPFFGGKERKSLHDKVMHTFVIKG
ncbi:RDD family protein [Bacteriovorax sp. PP10]|uniref:RDD family protein n=1 Tax=Bacteriovorax antarcticus TaxID=3088717 RepID=A0ABU5VS85_9BACT|nr:RDD family protein [Bacteriovorax sp. PP10]MEA9355909.1 RDD family protein [Bacteriovorax sp. PP10]